MKGTITRTKHLKLIVIFLMGLLIGYIVSNHGTYSENTASTESNNFVELPSPENDNSIKTSMPDERSLITFNNDVLGLSFKYPASFGNLDFQIRDGSESGRIFYGSFEKGTVWFGGVTQNFSEGRGVGFIDYDGNLTWYDDKPVKKIITVDGGHIKILKGTGQAMPGNHLMEGRFGALLQLKGEEFKGAAFATDSTLEEFESLLETIVLK